MAGKKATKKKSETNSETKPRFTRFAPEMDAWLERRADEEGYTSVQELLRHIVRVYRAQIEREENKS